MSHRAEDIDAPEYLADMRWRAAFGHWQENNGGPLADLVKSGGTPPEWALEFLADLIEGKVSREGGRPLERFPQQTRAILAEAFRAWEAASAIPRGPLRQDDPKVLACAQVAAARGIRDDAVRGILDDARALGVTLEAWRKWGRPDWSVTKPKGV